MYAIIHTPITFHSCYRHGKYVGEEKHVWPPEAVAIAETKAEALEALRREYEGFDFQGREAEGLENGTLEIAEVSKTYATEGFGHHAEVVADGMRFHVQYPFPLL